MDIVLRIDELPEFLHLHGYEYDADKYSKRNVSPKIRGTINSNNQARIAKLYADDMKLFTKWTWTATTTDLDTILDSPSQTQYRIGRRRFAYPAENTIRLFPVPQLLSRYKTPLCNRRI